MPMRRLELIDPPPATSDAPEPGPRLRIAVATRDGRALDAHFGSASRFVIYEVTPRDSRFVAVISFDVVSDESGAHKTEGDDRIGPKVAALAGCHLLFVLAIGGPAAVKVVNARIHPVKLPAPEPVEAVIGKVQAMMSGNPPPWLRKVMGASAPRSMQFLDEEGDA